MIFKSMSISLGYVCTCQTSGAEACSQKSFCVATKQVALHHVHRATRGRGLFGRFGLHNVVTSQPIRCPNDCRPVACSLGGERYPTQKKSPECAGGAALPGSISRCQNGVIDQRPPAEAVMRSSLHREARPGSAEPEIRRQVCSICFC